MNNLPFILGLAMLCLLPATGFSQTSISGFVVDSAKAPLPAATIMLLRAEDSILANFGITDNRGFFTVEKVQPGDYYMQVTYVGYVDYTEPISIGEEGNSDLAIVMKTEAQMLNSVTIEGIAPAFRLNGDTLEYKADRFETMPNAAVEELLKTLPGLEVDDDGTVRAQGEEVDKVLVDGKEFFGDDPTMATKNLPADAVDKVQVFDQLSDLSRFTGIDDGERDKTLNLVLKDDKKNGVFGKVEGGYGLEDTYYGKFNLHRFTKKQQLSLIGNANNVYETPFSLRDYIQFMGGIRSLMQSGGRIELNGEGASAAFMPGSDVGTVHASAAGFNLNQQLGKNKSNNLSLNYLFNRRHQLVEETTERLGVAGDEGFRTDLFSETDDLSMGHNLSSVLDLDIDSVRRLRFRASASWSDGTAVDQTLTNNLDEDLNLESFSNRNWLAEGTQASASGNLTYNRRLGKPGRNLAVQASGSRDRPVNDAWLTSDFSLLQDMDTLTQNLEQRYEESSSPWNAMVNFTYTEPVGKRSYLGLSASHSESRENFLRTVYDVDPAGEVPVERLSSEYVKRWANTQTATSLRRVGKDVNLNFRLGAQRSVLRGDFLSSDTVIEQTFYHAMPGFNLDWEIGRGTRLGLDYSTRLTAPDAERLNPVPDISNPLSVVIGNPELRPEYAHEVSSEFFRYDMFSFTSFFARVSVSYTDDKISWSRKVDSLLRQTAQPVNLRNGLAVTGSTRFSKPVRFMKSKFSIGAQARVDRQYEDVNELENRTRNVTLTTDAQLGNRDKGVFDLNGGARYTWNRARYSLNTELDRDIQDWTFYSNFRVRFLKTWAFKSSFNYLLYGESTFTAQQDIALLEASLTKYIFKANRGEITLVAKDLLNQNTGIDRSLNAAFAENTNAPALGRYVMLRLAWSPSFFGSEGRHGGMFIGE